MKKVLKGFILLSLLGIVGINYFKSNNPFVAKDLILMNIEALAASESDDEFFAATGCRADFSSTCGSHSYAYKASN